MNRFPQIYSSSLRTRRVSAGRSVLLVGIAAFGFELLLLQPSVAHAQAAPNTTTTPAPAGDQARPATEPAQSSTAPLYAPFPPPMDQEAPAESKPQGGAETYPETPTDMNQASAPLRERGGFFMRATGGPTFIHIATINNTNAQFSGFNGAAINVTLEIGGALGRKFVLAGVLAGDFLLTSKQMTQVSGTGTKKKSSLLEAERLAAEALVFPIKDSGLNFGLSLGVTALLSNPFSFGGNDSSASGVFFSSIQAGYDLSSTKLWTLTIQGHLGTTLAQFKSGDLGAPMHGTWLGLQVGATYF